MTDTTQLELPEVSGPMSATQLRMMQRAIDILRQLPVQFVVAAPDDRVFKVGDWELVQKKTATGRKPKRAPKYPYGSIRRHVEPFMQNMKPGDVVKVPVGDFDLDTIQGGVCNYGSKNWGRESYTTARSGSEQVVEVMRVS